MLDGDLPSADAKTGSDVDRVAFHQRLNRTVVLDGPFVVPDRRALVGI